MRHPGSLFSSWLLTMALLVGLSTTAWAQTIRYVDAAATGANDGTSWANAFTHLQDALAAAQSSDEIWVAVGTYHPHESDPQVTFSLVDGVSVYGGFSGTEAQRDERNSDPATNGTVLSGDIDPDPDDGVLVASEHVVTAIDLPGGVTLDGFTITGGGAPVERGGGIFFRNAGGALANLIITEAIAFASPTSGGGIYLEGADAPTLTNVAVRNNTGGGVFIQGPATVSLAQVEVAENAGDGIQVVGATVTVDDSVLRDNTGRGLANLTDLGGASGEVTITNSVISGNTTAALGGGLYNAGTLALRNSTISNNSNTSTSLDGLLSMGGGLMNEGSAVVALCVFEGNTVNGTGGGLRNRSRGTAIVVGTAFIDNVAGADGGGVFHDGTSLELHNSFFFGNEADQGGGLYNEGTLDAMNLLFSGNDAGSLGGAVFSDGQLTLRNATLYGNTALQAGGILADFGSGNSLTLYNSILWGNDAPNSPQLARLAPTAGHSLVQGGLPAGSTDLGGNLDADPLFADADGPDDVAGTLDDDLRLTEGSPAEDAGNDDWVPPDLHDIDGDSDTDERWPVDIGDPPGGADVQTPASSLADARVSGRIPAMQHPAQQSTILPERARILGHRVDAGSYEGPRRIIGPTRYRSTANYRWVSTGGDPVSTFTGELFFYEARLLDLGGPLPLFLQPYYAALLESDGRIQSALGPNWSHNFDARLVAVDASTIEAVSSRGRVTTFAQQQDGTWQQTDALDLPLQLVAVGDGFLLGDPRSGHIQALDADGRLTKIEDGQGNTLTLSYDAQDRLASVSDGLGRTLTFEYNGQSRLVGVSDGTRTVAFAYDGQGRLASLSNAEGETTIYAYDGDSNYLTAATQPGGETYYTQDFDAEGRVTAQANAHGHTWQFSYGDLETTVADPKGDSFTHGYTAAGQVQVYTDPFGNTVALAYEEASGRRNQVTDRLGGVTRTTYHAASGLPETVTEANGSVTTYSYTARTVTAAAKRRAADLTVYDLTGITLPDGGTVSITRDEHGNATSVTDPAGDTWSFTYNDHSQVLTATNPEGGTTTATYNADGTLASSTDAAGNTTAFGYDNLRRLTTITRADGTARSFSYDDADRLLSVTDEEGRTWTFAYDANGNLMSATDPSGEQIQYAYDAMGRLTRVTGRTGGVTEITYDALGNRRTVTDPNGHTTTYGYDALSRLTSITDGAGQAWQLAYDAEGVPASITDPLGNTTTFTTNAMGWVTQATNALGNATGITYDVMGRPTAVQDPLGFSTAYGRDALGRLAQTTLPGGAAAAYARDGLGLIEQVTDPNGEAWGYDRDAQGRLTATTDPLSRTASTAYDNRNRPSQITLPGGGTLALAYDGTGSVTGLTYSDGTSLSFDYDANGWLVGADGVTLQRDAAGRLAASNGLGLGRDDGGRLESVTYAPGKTVTYTYDGRGLVTAVTDWLEKTTTLAYDGAGRLTAITRPNGVTTAYIYDAAGRLLEIEETTGAAGKKAAATLASTLLVRDARGQVTNATRDVPAPPEQAPTLGTWTVDAAGQLEGPTYDPLGHLAADDARTYTWDLAGRLTSYTENGTTVEASYDAFGSRTRRTEGGTTKTYVWNYGLALPSVAVERTGDTDARYYVTTPDGLLLYSIDAFDEGRHFYHYDEMGNTQVVTADDGAVLAAYAYSPYGEVLGETGDLDNPVTWQGAYGVLCEDGFCYARARYYDPTLRRFLSPDPIKSLHPAEVTPYQYARGNPQRFVDPTGLQSRKSGLDYEEEREQLKEALFGGNLSEKKDLLLFLLELFRAVADPETEADGGVTWINPPSPELDAGLPSDDLDDLREDLTGGVLLGDTVIPNPTPVEHISVQIIRAGRAVYNAAMDASEASARNADVGQVGALDECLAVDPTDAAAFTLNAGATYGTAGKPVRSTCLARYYDLYWFPVWVPSYREARWKWLTWRWVDWWFYGWWPWWDYWEEPVVSRREDQHLLRSQFQLLF